MASSTKNPQTVTIYGRLSFPVWKFDDAVQRNAKSKFPATDPNTVTPEFNLIVEQPQLDKLVTHILDEYLPSLEAAAKADPTKAKVDVAGVAKLVKAIRAGDWDTQPPYLPIKPVPEKTVELAPEGVAMIKVKGNRGVDIELKAIVQNEDELAVPDPDRIQYPAVVKLSEAVHEMYAGCYVAATLNLYAFVSGKLPGISASAGVAVFKMDGDRFGGGIAVDEDEIFLD